MREKTTISLAGNGSCPRDESILAFLLNLRFWNHTHLDLGWVRRFHHKSNAKITNLQLRKRKIWGWGLKQESVLSRSERVNLGRPFVFKIDGCDKSPPINLFSQL